PLTSGGAAHCGSYFAGAIDEVRVYSVALTPAEILANGSNGRAIDASQVACTGTATFDTAAAGSGKAVAVNSISLIGPDAGSYALSTTTATTTASITPAPVTASATVANKPYDGTTTAIATSTAVGTVTAHLPSC